mmetsp:Transcript_5914/g.10685  ORF Transcript_5914/g.10685 Transcript_5914/m.10685 type:complete len:389 (-) Transcript_5914:1043-2209(-)
MWVWTNVLAGVTCLFALQVTSFQIGTSSRTSSRASGVVEHPRRGNAFTECGLVRQQQSSRQETQLYAETKQAPQYQKQDAILRKVEPTGKGNFLLHVDYERSNDNSGEAVLEYQPGNVLALEIESPASLKDTTPAEFAVMNEKTKKDLTANGGWLRGPYTVSRSTSSGFQILIKEVGYKSHIFAEAEPGTPVKFGGKFKVPIVEGILNSLELEGASRTERVVMVATGVGIGPCVGAIETMVQEVDSASSYSGRIDLLASFRTEEDVAMEKDLNRLAAEYPQRFQWKSIISSKVGRISGNQESLESYLKPNDDGDSKICSVQNTHYHLIGNGQLVNEWKAGLEKAGVPSERVTFESYFNTMSEADMSAVENIACIVKKLAVPERETAQC